MKIIEALKKTKDLARKVDDLKKRIAQYCADLDFENPTYPDQRAQVDSWIQSANDSIKEILRLRTAIQKTNVNTFVTVTISDKPVKKTIAEWIHRRKDLANLELQVWTSLTDKNLKDGSVQQSDGKPLKVAVRRYYTPSIRDAKIEELRSEPSLIDGSLEIANAVTDLIE